MKHTTILSLCALAHVFMCPQVNADVQIAGTGSLSLGHTGTQIQSFNSALGTLDSIDVVYSNLMVGLDYIIDVDSPQGAGAVNLPSLFSFEKTIHLGFSASGVSFADTGFLDFSRRRNSRSNFDLSGLEGDDGDSAVNFTFNGGLDEKSVFQLYELGTQILTIPDDGFSSTISPLFSHDSGEPGDITFRFRFDPIGISLSSDGQRVEYHNQGISQLSGDYSILYNFTPAAVPEPATYGLILGGLALFFVYRYKMKH